MKVLLLRDARVSHKAGETVEVSSVLELNFLVSVGSAQIIETAMAEPKVETADKTPKKTRKKV